VVPVLVIIISYLASKYLSNKLVVKSFGFGEISETVSLEKGERFTNYILDRIIAFYFAFTISDSLQNFLKYSLHSTDDYSFNSYEWVVSLSFIFLILLYYILSEGLFQVTLGKIITKSIVIDADGRRISFGKAIGRTFCRIIPLEPFSFLFGERGWHDTITETYVVKTDENPTSGFKNP
jgi:uncharacterized RDD family membrane protein YckC